MKLITLFVGNKLDHVVNFDPEEEQIVETYIIKREEITDIFAFYHGIGGEAVISKKKRKLQDNGNEILFQSNDGESTVHIEKISAEEDTTAHEITINVELTNDKDVTEMELSGLEDAGLEFYSNDPALWTMTLESESKEPVMVKLIFLLKIGKRSYKQHLQLCVAKEKDISDVVLDFGSEASQMGIFKRGAPQTRSDIRELFTEMESLLSMATPVSGTIPATLSDSYVQRDKDRHFFKSVFFAKKKFTDAEAGTPIPELDATGMHVKENKVIKMLTTQMQAQNLVKKEGFIQIPNVKITQFGGVLLPSVGPDNVSIHNYQNDYFYRASINHFVLDALKNAATPCISLYVLMPNVYSVISIINHLRWIRQDMLDILDKNPTLAEKIKAVELSAISESDASLLGAIRVIEDNNQTDEIVEAGKYIIIDAGKGTLDYSAIKYETDPSPKVYSIYRSGIIGAGNALTYAYLFALLRDYMDMTVSNIPTEDDLQSFIYENVLGRTSAGISKGGGDIANLLKLTEAVERYKILANSDGRRADNGIDPLSNKGKHANWRDVEMTTVTNFVNKMIPDETRTYKPLSEGAKQYVTKTINQLVDQVYGSLKILKSMDYGKADGVIFAGRGFALPEFKEALKRKLEENGIADEELTYMRNGITVNQKNVCLYIRTAIQKGHYNNHMTSVPIVMRKSYQAMNIEGKKDMFTKLQEKFGFGIKKADSDIVQKGVDFLKVILDSREGAYHTPGNTEANGMVNGFKSDIVNGDSLMIGGTKYNIAGINGDITIFFTGEKIFYRFIDNHGRMRVNELTEDRVDAKSSPFLFGTLFPNVFDFVDSEVDYGLLPFNPNAEKEKQKEEEDEKRKKIKKKKREEGTEEKDKDGNRSGDNTEDENESGGGDGTATDKALELAKRV